MNLKVKKNIMEIIFILSLLPLILNWIVGLFFLDQKEKRTYIYRNFTISFVFLIISVLIYILYLIITNIYFSLIINYIFFILQILFIFFYTGMSILQIWSYKNNLNLNIFKIIDNWNYRFKLLLNDNH